MVILLPYMGRFHGVAVVYSRAGVNHLFVIPTVKRSPKAGCVEKRWFECVSLVKMASIKALFLVTCVVVCLADVDETPRGPHIVREPQDTIFDKDSNLVSISMECEADGFPRPSYKWFKNEAEINILQDDRLTLMEGTLTISQPRDNVDQGSYRCQAENIFGIVISRKAELLFGYVDPFPTRAQPPKIATANLGFMLECKPPDAFPALTFFWYKDSEANFVRESGRVMVASNGNLYFAKVEEQDDGNYFCVVKSSLDPVGTGAGQDLRISKPIDVTVVSNTFDGYRPPRVSHAVQDQVVLEGEDVRLECFFEGSPVPRLSWQRTAPKSKLIPRSATYDNQNQVLILRKIRLEDAGNYQCVAASSPNDDPNTQEQTASSTGTIDVRAPPKWVKQLDNVDADIESNAIFECEAAGTEPIQYNWYRNGELLTVRARHSFSNNRKRLSIVDLQQDDSAMFQCQASNVLLNKERAIYSTGQLRVLALEPSFDKNPMVQNQPAAKNGNVTIVCDPEAAPKPQYTWFHNNVEVNTGGRYTILENGNLFISGVVASDGGRYKCKVENYLGTAEDEGQLIIRDGTVITKWPMSKTMEVGESTTLDCRATSDPLLDLTYIWMLDNRQIDIDEDPHYKRLKDGNLEIVDAGLQHGGVYKCVALTTIDEVSRSASVIIKGPPGPPAGVIASDVTANSCQLRWSKGSESNDPIKSYTIESRTGYEPEWVVERDNIPPTGLSVGLNNLSPWSEYEFRVIATNDIGRGQPSRPSEVYNTQQDKPYNAPRNVGGGGGQLGDLRITWDPLSRQEQNAGGVGYDVYWKRLGASGVFSSERVYVQTEGVYTVKDVPTYVEYQVRVGAFNSYGSGPNSTITTVYSHEAAPTDYPRDVTAEARSGSEIKVSWRRISLTNLKGKLGGYKIHYWPSNDGSEATASIATSPGVGTSHTVTGLEPRTEYQVIVLAYSGGGNGPASRNPVTVTTKKAAPLQAPYNVKASLLSRDSVSVTWNEISTSRYEEPLEGYKILYYLDGRFERDAQKVTVKGSDTTKGTVSGLQLGRAYLVQVQGYSEGGDGVTSEPIKVEMYGARPLVGGAPSMQCISISLLSIICLLHIFKYLW